MDSMNGQSERKVCVIGAGTMGSGIAAHLANLGFNVSLLDLTIDSCREAFERAKKARPPHFFVPNTADAVRLGSIRDDLHFVREADWVCEAIIEKMEAKRALFAQIEPLLRSDALISTNTSGLQISLLTEGRSPDFKRRFMGTHFFNPPRYLKLLELIPTAETDPKEIERMTRFLEEQVARRVVPAKDTPGFIANRFGMWAMIHAIHTAEKLQLSVEQVDAITGPFLGRPRSASFRLNDIVGLDIMQDISSNLFERCPTDPHRDTLLTPKSMATLLERGWIGEKAGQGYYRREGKEFLAFDLQTLAYRDKRDASFASLDAVAKKPLGERIASAMGQRDEAGEFLKQYLVPVLRYADYLKEEISHNVLDFDRVMKWGFGWEMGPFEMIDAIGHELLEIPGGPFYRPGEMRSFSDGYVSLPNEPEFRTIRDFPLIEQHPSFNVRDLGDGIAAIAITTKMGVITPTLVLELKDYLSSRDGRWVLTSEGKSFSVGYDLQFLLQNGDAEQFQAVEDGLRDLQELADLISSKRIVAAIYGHCLGAGLELAAACALVVAHPETQIGLPEAKVGLLPGGSGTAMMRLRSQGDAKQMAEMILQLTLGATSSNAAEAKKLLYLRSSDPICFHPDRLIHEAILAAKTVEPQPRPEWSQSVGPLAGMADQALDDARTKGDLTDYDLTIGTQIKAVFRTPTREEALSKEREEFEHLLTHALTHARIKHMLDNGKPLRN